MKSADLGRADTSPPEEPEPPEETHQLVLGLDTLGDRTYDADDRPQSHAQTVRNVVEQGDLADQVGVDFFGIGQHHTDDFPVPAADVVLGAIAARTARIRLGSAVTVLSILTLCPSWSSRTGTDLNWVASLGAAEIAEDEAGSFDRSRTRAFVIDERTSLA